MAESQTFLRAKRPQRRRARRNGCFRRLGKTTLCKFHEVSEGAVRRLRGLRSMRSNDNPPHAEMKCMHIALFCILVAEILFSSSLDSMYCNILSFLLHS